MEAILKITTMIEELDTRLRAVETEHSMANITRKIEGMMNKITNN